MSSGYGTVFIDTGAALVNPRSDQIATVAAGSYVSKITVNGMISFGAGTGNIAVGNVNTYNIVAGIQYGNHGYTPTNITNGTGAPSNWWTLHHGIGGQEQIIQADALAPTPNTEEISMSLRIDLRRYIYVPVLTDVYLSIGGNTALGTWFTFRAMYSAYVEIASFP